MQHTLHNVQTWGKHHIEEYDSKYEGQNWHLHKLPILYMHDAFSSTWLFWLPIASDAG